MENDAAVLCGLGNPGRRYQGTRHNLGFLVAERFAQAHGAAPFRGKFNAEWTEVSHAGRRVYVVLPQTYMNLSGDALVPFMNYFKIKPAGLLVVCDDINLPFPEFRIKPGGGAGGHKGLVSVASRLGTQTFARFRFGVGGGELSETSDYVLSDFTAAERRELPDRIDEACAAIDLWLEKGLDAAMNKFNGTVDTPPTV